MDGYFDERNRLFLLDASFWNDWRSLHEKRTTRRHQGGWDESIDDTIGH